MKTIGGIDAIRMMQEVSKLPDGMFNIAFYKFNRTTGEASTRLQVRKGCTTRAQLPQDRFEIPSDNYFLFQDADANPKTCFRMLLRFIGFPPEYNMLKVNWFKDE